MLERLGLRREGHFVQNVWFKGKWGDEYLYAILRNEWLQRRDKQSHKLPVNIELQRGTLNLADPDIPPPHRQKAAASGRCQVITWL